MKKCIMWIVIILLLGCIGCEIYFIIDTNKKKDIVISNEVANSPEGAEEKFEIYIRHTTFSGAISEEQWEKEKEANDKQKAQKYEVYEGDVIKLDGKTIKDIEMEIISVSEEEIKIKLNEKMSYSYKNSDEKGGLLETKKAFTIEKGDKLKLVTPTIDASDTYEIEYR